VDDVNGEEVERRAREQQWIEFVRCGVSGIGFAMGVLGIWGDGS
jgi:autophagy-related protein 33